MIVNLYSSSSSMWAIGLVELGDISDWVSGGNYGCWNSMGNGMYGYGNSNFSGRPAGTPLNKIDYGTTAGIALYANSSLQSNFSLGRYGSGDQSGYSLITCSYPGVVYAPGLGIAYGDYWRYISDVYMATARINGQLKIGFLICSQNPYQPNGAAFCTEDNWSARFLEEVKIIDNSNPYYEGGYSKPDGGDPQKQNWTEDSDFVKEDAMPDEEFYGAIATGLVTLFHPTKEQLRRLASVLWADSFWNFVQNAIQNIGDLFISLGMMPFFITGGDNVEVTWFNYAVTGATSKTDVYLRLCENQFMEFDMGSIALDGSDDRIFATDSVLDYSPYSKLGIFLPFIGYQELDIDECRGQILYLKYRVDILSGTCVALISLRPLGEDPQNSRTIYQFTGNCLTQLPLTAVDAQTMITNAVNLGISLVGVGTAGAIASAGDAVTAEMQTRENHPISAAQGELRNKQGMASVASAGGSLASATVNAVMGMKPDFKHSGAIGASSSLLSVKQPYLFLTTPRQSMPEGYNKVCGFPCNIYGNIGDFEGFTVVEDVRLNGLVATSPEVEEIYYLLKKGIII